MKLMSSIRRTNRVRGEGRGCPRWTWALLAAWGCLQWPAPEGDAELGDTSQEPAGQATEGGLAAAERRPLASTSAGQSLQQDAVSAGLDWQTRLGSSQAAEVS